MRYLYFLVIFCIGGLCVVISLKVFFMTLGIKPVLQSEIKELNHERRNILIMVATAISLFLLSVVIGLIGGF